MLNPQETLNSLSERFKATASVNTVFGESRTVEGRTIIPVSKVAYALGAGGGEGRQSLSTETAGERVGSGGGGGGAVFARPVGFLVVDSDGEHFVPVGLSKRRLIAACFAGFMMGLMIRGQGRKN